MKYPVAVWKENNVYTAEIPSLPGVITEADSIEELEAAVKEAASGWMEAELDDGRSIPKPIPIDELKNKEDFCDCVWMLVDINLDALSDKTERVNICLPSRVLRRLDFLAKEAGNSRSGYLSELVLGQANQHESRGCV